MYLNIALHKMAKYYAPYDRKTGEMIKDCVAGNDETGRMERAVRDEQGRFILLERGTPYVRIAREFIERDFEFKSI